MFNLFIVLSFNSSLERYPTKCLFLNNEPCMVRPTLIDMDPVQLRYYPFMTRLNLKNCSFAITRPTQVWRCRLKIFYWTSKSIDIIFKKN